MEIWLTLNENCIWWTHDWDNKTNRKRNKQPYKMKLDNKNNKKNDLHDYRHIVHNRHLHTRQYAKWRTAKAHAVGFMIVVSLFMVLVALLMVLFIG